MKKNDVFTFTAPNGVEMTAVVVARYITKITFTSKEVLYICYSQNRLFSYRETIQEDPVIGKRKTTKFKYDEIIVDYCVLPDYDAILERYNDIEVAQAETQSGI